MHVMYTRSFVFRDNFSKISLTKLHSSHLLTRMLLDLCGHALQLQLKLSSKCTERSLWSCSTTETVLQVCREIFVAMLYD